MKTCKNFRTPFLQIELSSIIRFYAISDIFRFLLLLGPMLSLFFGCTNLHPMRPELVIGITNNNGTAPDYVLYKGNRSFLSPTEERMLGNVEIKCQKIYRDYLPVIWTDARPTLMKALNLQGTAMVLPVFSAICFLMFHKKDRVSSYLALMHFIFEILSATLSVFGNYFISDRRLCFLANFSTSVSIPVLLWFLNITFAIFYKSGVLYSLELYIRNFWNSTRSRAGSYHAPSPYEELRAYLIELKSLGVTPRVEIEIPDDPNRRDWIFVNSTIKRILQEIRLQIAELHRDDPLVHDLLKSGKLQQQAAQYGRRSSRRGNSISSAGTTGGSQSVLHIAKMMSSKNAEYKLLKNHQHHHHHHYRGTRTSAEGGAKDDVDVILPEPDLRFDSEYTNT